MVRESHAMLQWGEKKLPTMATTIDRAYVGTRDVGKETLK